MASRQTAPLEVSAQPKKKLRPIMPTQQRKDIEWRCPQCKKKNTTNVDTAANVKELLKCKKCQWKGVLGEAASAEESTVNEAPMGGVLAIVHQVERDRLMIGLVVYLIFCAIFVGILTLARPFHQVFEVQNSIFKELIEHPMPVAHHKHTFMQTASWEEYWGWVNTVLMPKVYGETIYEDLGMHARVPASSVRKAPYTRFSIGRYNRVISAIRFRQVRVKPTLPRCERIGAGDFPSPYQQACAEESFVEEQSCITPEGNHELSRPCWGAWSEEWQETAYPNAIQKETLTFAVDPANPQMHVNCLATCQAYYVDGFRTAEQWPEFNDTQILQWTAMHGIFEVAEVGNERCQTSCNVSRSAVVTGQSNVWGRDAVSSYCGSDESLTGTTFGACVGDVVDLPLEPEEARQRVDAMQRERWANEATRMVAVEINTYNPNYDLLTASRILIEISEGGRFQPWVEIMSCRLSLFMTGWDSLRLVLEITFCFFIAFYFAIEGVELYTKRLKYFQDPWNFLELANLTIYAATIIMWFHHCLTRDTSPFEARDSTSYHDLYTLVQDFNNVNAVSSFNLVYGNVRFFKYLRFHGKLRMLWLALAWSMKAVVPIMIIFFIFLTGFGFAGHLVFGAQVYEFHDLKEAIPYLVLSVQDGVEYSPLKNASPFYAPLWQLFWYVFSTLILVNFLIAVVVDSFGRVKGVTTTQADAIEEYMNKGVRFSEGPILFTVMDYFPNNTRRFVGWWRSKPWRRLTPEGREAARKNQQQQDELEQQRWAEQMRIHKELSELHEAIREIDIDDLWDRCLVGIRRGEISLNADDLKFLFKDEEYEAAHSWLIRVMQLGHLDPVEPETVVTTLGAIADVEASMRRLGKEVDKCSRGLQDRFEDIRHHVEKGYVPGYGDAAELGTKSQQHARDFLDFLKHHATIHRGDQEESTHGGSSSTGSVGEDSRELPLLPHNMEEAHAPEMPLPPSPNVPGRVISAATTSPMQPAASTRSQQPRTISKNISHRDAARELSARRQMLKEEEKGHGQAPLQPLPLEGNVNSTVHRYLSEARPMQTHLRWAN